MNVQEFSDQRLINTIKQAYNFNPGTVKAAIKEAMDRGIINQERLQALMEESKVMEEKSREMDRQEQEKLSKVAKRNESAAKIGAFISLIIFALGIFSWVFTGYFFLIFVGAGLGGATYTASSGIFKGRFRR